MRLFRKPGRTLKKTDQSPKRDLNAELLESIADVSAGSWARKTELTRRTDGSVRRRIVLNDGTVERDDIVSATDWALGR